MKKEIKKILVLSLIFSIIIYILGILSGIKYGNEILKTFQSENNFTIIKEELNKVARELNNLKFFIFSEVLKEGEKCKMLEFLLNELEKTLKKYHSILPYRLEEYELKESLPQDYYKAKELYQDVLLDTWFISKSYEKCDEKVISILYFYKPKCKECVEQGKEMDKIRDYLKSLNFKVFLFTLDINYEDPRIKILKNIYNLSDAPSFIVRDFTFSNFTSFETFKFYFNETQEKRN